MKLLSINVSEPEQLEYRGRLIDTAIHKQPLSGPVMVRSLNIDGDGQANLEVHGGVHQAVYVYSSDNYDYWSTELDRTDLQYGQFGENLTVTGMPDAEIRIGDRFFAGDAEFEVTQPRAPCYKLAMKMGLPDFVLQFRASGRPGFYCKVIQEGTICAGDTVQHEPVAGESMTIRDVFMLRYFDQDNYARIRECAALAALAPRWRESLQKLLLKDPG